MMSLLYLLLLWRRPDLEKLLPTSDSLDKLIYKTIGIGFPLLTLMIAAGAYRANRTWGSYWSWDPKETWAAITWLVYAGYLHMRITRGWRGWRAAYFAILGFAVVMFTFFGVTICCLGYMRTLKFLEAQADLLRRAGLNGRVPPARPNSNRSWSSGMEQEELNSMASTSASVDMPDLRISSVKHRKHVRLNWQTKTLIPVAAAFLNGVLVFLFATLTLLPHERQKVLLVAAAGAVVICGILLITLAVVVRRPMLELQDKIQRVADGDLSVQVGFSDRNDDIGDLGRNFNNMVQQLPRADRRSNTCAAHRCRAPNTWLPWENWLPDWRTRFVIRWPASPASCKSFGAICRPTAPLAMS